MESWIDRLAASLGEEGVSPAETSEILTVARDVAHRVERKITPISTYLLGIAVGRDLASGTGRRDALAARSATLRASLPEAPAADQE
jgi:hypothetical protein